MGNKKKLIKLISICLIFTLAAVCFFVYPSIYEYQCKTRNFDEFDKIITSDIFKSTIAIVNEKKTNKENVTSISYGAGASGVVFDSVGDTYYAVTAYHVVQHFENIDYIVIPYGAPTYSEYSKNSESYVSNEMYYGQFEKATVVFLDEEYDLAVISFKSKETLSRLLLNKTNPQYNEKIAIISNPEGERFIQSFGVITSNDYYNFESNDGLLPIDVFKHNAYINQGSSGSVVLNQEMRIVGVNVGGGTDFFNRFKYGVMVPCELINRFLEKNGFKK
ncbi:MAG: hypothetical protein K0S04_822, partial [Herbinix sp.]|nr:hypothetical protein [Herbinix sp.]